MSGLVGTQQGESSFLNFFSVSKELLKGLVIYFKMDVVSHFFFKNILQEDIYLSSNKSREVSFIEWYDLLLYPWKLCLFKNVFDVHVYIYVVSNVVYR